MNLFERPVPDLGTEDDAVVRRILAFLVDAVGFFGVYLLAGLALQSVLTVPFAVGVFLDALAVLLFIAYVTYFEAEYGQTIGKMLANVVVVTEQGNAISDRESAIRNLLRIVDAVGFVAIYLTSRNQRVGDLAADTVVVLTKEQAGKL